MATQSQVLEDFVGNLTKIKNTLKRQSKDNYSVDEIYDDIKKHVNTITDLYGKKSSPFEITEIYSHNSKSCKNDEIKQLYYEISNDEKITKMHSFLPELMRKTNRCSTCSKRTRLVDIKFPQLILIIFQKQMEKYSVICHPNYKIRFTPINILLSDINSTNSILIKQYTNKEYSLFLKSPMNFNHFIYAIIYQLELIDPNIRNEICLLPNNNPNNNCIDHENDFHYNNINNKNNNINYDNNYNNNNNKNNYNNKNNLNNNKINNNVNNININLYNNINNYHSVDQQNNVNDYHNNDNENDDENDEKDENQLQKVNENNNNGSSMGDSMKKVLSKFQSIFSGNKTKSDDESKQLLADNYSDKVAINGNLLNEEEFGFDFDHHNNNYNNYNDNNNNIKNNNRNNNRKNLNFNNDASKLVLIPNLGNTCYLNSILQIVRHIFNFELFSQNNLSENNFFNEFIENFSEIFCNQNENSMKAVQKMIDYFNNNSDGKFPFIYPSEQGDTFAFFMRLIKEISEKSPNLLSKIEIQSTNLVYTCPKCKLPKIDPRGGLVNFHIGPATPNISKSSDIVIQYFNPIRKNMCDHCDQLYEMRGERTIKKIPEYLVILIPSPRSHNFLLEEQFQLQISGSKISFHLRCFAIHNGNDNREGHYSFIQYYQNQLFIISDNNYQRYFGLQSIGDPSYNDKVTSCVYSLTNI